MYLSHYQLNEKPFQINPDPKFLWLGEKHKEALAILKYGVLDNRGFLLLTGDVGTGKTTLINALLNHLGNDTIVATVPDPGLEILDFFNFIAKAFHIKYQFNSKEAFLSIFSNFLYKSHALHKKVLLIIDEAQRLNQDLLEEIRLLSNIEKQHVKLLNIFFVGQNEFNDIILEPENRALRQRITINYNIKPLTREEVTDYIRFRLRVAGSEKALFTSGAVKEIISFSKGYPRLINVLCDHSLLAGYVNGSDIVSAKEVKTCALEQKISPKRKERTQYLTPEKRASHRGWRIAGYAAVSLLFLLVAGFLYYVSEFGAYRFQPEAVPLPRPSAQAPALTHDAAENRAGKTGKEIRRAPGGKPDIERKTLSGRSAMEPLSKAEPTPSHRPLDLPRQKVVIPFEHNSNDLPESAYPTLNNLSAAMAGRPDARIIVRGYTDMAGTATYNKALSEFRANMVMIYLVGKGIPSSKIETMGMGAVDPIADNDTPAGRIRNRRVEIEVYRN